MTGETGKSEAAGADLPVAAQTAPHAERVRGADGVYYWKLTCVCGKQLLAPFSGPHKQGLCPQCGTSLLFPTERPITSGPLPIIPARKPAAQQRARVRPVKKRDASSDRINPGQSASDTAADKLRPHGGSVRMAKGLISAWPAADKLPRVLAVCVDLTVLTLFFALLLWAAPYFSPFYSLIAFRIAAVLVLYWFNEGVATVVWNASLGKKLARIVVRSADGEALPVETALLRPLVKLTLFPVWFLAFIDVNSRAPHDKLLNTLVLKGRAQRAS